LTREASGGASIISGGASIISGIKPKINVKHTYLQHFSNISLEVQNDSSQKPTTSEK